MTKRPSVGAGLLAKAVVQSTKRLNVLAPSRASPLPQGLRDTNRYRPNPRRTGGPLHRQAAGWPVYSGAINAFSRISP
ncbi:hypothetical protein C9422_03665 [Pseudomonas sp. B1(2018)]|nr:hypothetical protein C9422_03665 [Pseudomonas sp. B1(2018)]